jgi:undecaprenyl-diphosphatase
VTTTGPRATAGERLGGGTRALAGVAGLAAAGFTALAVAVAVRGGAPFPLDSTLQGWAVAHRTAGLTAAARVLTATGTGAVAYALAGVAGAVAGGRRRWWAGLLAAVAVLAVCEAVRYGISQVMARERPPRADWVLAASGHAFPSGHTTTSAVVAALACAAVTLRAPGTPWSALVRVVAVAWAVCVGLTRVYLGVHWPTDVAGGWLLATTLAGAGWVLLRALGPGRRMPRSRAG